MVASKSSRFSSPTRSAKPLQRLLPQPHSGTLFQDKTVGTYGQVCIALPLWLRKELRLFVKHVRIGSTEPDAPFFTTHRGRRLSKFDTAMRAFARAVVGFPDGLRRQWGPTTARKVQWTSLASGGLAEV